MKLPIPFLQKKPPIEHFLTLVLREEKISAIIFQSQNSLATIVGYHEEQLPIPLSNSSVEQWLTTIDKTISTAESSLRSSNETYKTIFGVSQSWVEDAKIKKEYLIKLKKISEDLSLNPIGFLVVNEAIAHLLQKKEGAPISALFVEIGFQKTIATLVRAGKIIESHATDSTSTPIETVDTLLKHFTSGGVFPSRILLLQEDANETVTQQFTIHSWSKSLPFFHIPKVTAISDAFIQEAILFGAASQLALTLTEITIPQKNPQILSSESLIPLQKQVIPEPIEEIPPSVLTPEELGFYENVDIAIKSPVQSEPSLKPTITHEQISTELPAQPLITNEETIEEEDLLLQTSPSLHTTPIHQDNFTKVQEQKPNQNPKKIVIPPLFKIILEKITLLKNNPRFPKKIFLIPPAILFLLLCGIYLYIFNLKTVITLEVKPEIIEEEKQITFSAKSDNSFAKGVIKATIVSTSLSGSLTTPATGKKEIGEKAKGTVTLYSRFTQSKTFPAGTVFTSSNDIVFTLDKEVTISSSSADASAAPTTTKANLTAKEIGKEGNLPSGTKFTVGTFDITDIVAKNDTAFSGGSKKEVTVVARENIDDLVDNLPKKLESKAKTQLEKQIPENAVMIPLFVNTLVTKKDFDKKIGDEAKEITLDATVTFESLFYTKSDINSYSKFAIEDRIIEKNSTLGEGIKQELKKPTVTNENEIKGNLAIQALLFPQFDEDSIKESLAGKSFSDANLFLTKLPQISSVSISLHPAIPFLPEIISQQKDNISFVKNHSSP